MHAYTRGWGVQPRTNEQAVLQTRLFAGPLPTIFEWISFPPARRLVKRIGADSSGLANAVGLWCPGGAQALGEACSCRKDVIMLSTRPPVLRSPRPVRRKLQSNSRQRPLCGTAVMYSFKGIRVPKYPARLANERTYLHTYIWRYVSRYAPRQRSRH
jgi:hypothetical protein